MTQVAENNFGLYCITFFYYIILSSSTKRSITSTVV